jgi:tetratricopeptide (TPR) repeat protein
MDPTANLEAMIASGSDGAPIRLLLASRYAAAGEIERALQHAEVAVRLDADYSAAWKLLGRMRSDSGRAEEAMDAYRQGILVAERRGDKQAAKEMRVFLKRLERATQNESRGDESREEDS